jgi:nitroimidazol reductase NimA-like FMN-containing flavoprotein (pyridoxamine 5'-phosphate oxidase superfamily)
MNPNLDANGFVVLDRRACLDRLAQHRVAALAITDHALPVVLPAWYTLRNEDILVGASMTGILGRRMPDSIISLCVHDLDDELMSGWTVTVTGRAVALTSPDDLAAAADLRQWGAEDATQIVVRVGTERISGRQIPLRQVTRLD